MGVGDMGVGDMGVGNAGTEQAVGQKSVVESVWDLLEADSDLDDDAKYVVIAALDSDQALADQLGGSGVEHHRPESDATSQEPAGAFLREIQVSGFRGIGPQATLQITPSPGITVVSGRNGSGKSSFAEALEYALTGESYRWRNKKARLWADTWRNLHQPNPCDVQVEFTVENGPTTSIGAQWESDAELDDAKRWSQRKGEKREDGVDALGWSTAVEVHRPILSYDEIGGLLEQEPSKLYDALNKLLALDEILDAESRLTAELSERQRPRKEANSARTALKKAVTDVDDPNVQALAKLVKPNKFDLDAIAELASGVSGTRRDLTDGLQRIIDLQAPDVDGDTVATELRDALVTLRTLADDTIKLAEKRSEILAQAIAYRAAADDPVTCPVCEEGVLSEEWETHAREAMMQADNQLALYREAQKVLQQKEGAARSALSSLPVVDAVPGVELATLETYRKARETATEAVDVGDLANHLTTQLPAAHDALAALQKEATASLAEHESIWGPIAEQTMEWVALERKARESDSTLAQVEAAKKWVAANAQVLREERLKPIEEAARSIWAQLRQESDVEISKISLIGSRTHRKALLEGLVDGQPAGALSVMSQGELHALALALFLPRATASSSPFRFIVLDDPIQAMDPAKIDGFLNVLKDLAVTRQIIVFSHDDRLATAIRQQSIDAHLIEVTRESGSTLVVKPAEDPARRYVEDAFALVADENVPAEIKQRACPALFRFAIESAARQVYFTRRNVEGKAQQESEGLWSAATTVNSCVALALKDDKTADISGWRAYRAYRWPALQIANKGVHQGATVTKDDLSALRRTVADLLEGQ